MLKKRILVISSVVIFAIFILSGVFAADSNSTSNDIEKGYDCLKGLIDDKTASTISLQEAVFSTLALGSNGILNDKIDGEKSSSAECWPKDKCKVKETSQVGLAYDRIGKNTNDIVDWLYTKNGTSEDLIWYLEIDATNHESSECTIRYDGIEKNIEILDDMTLSGSPGSCFTISSDDYFLQFKPSCYQKEIEISCDKDFITTLVYTKKGSDTLYVLPETHSSSALGTTSEKVNVQCFKTDGKCDYEGSLWSAFLLYKLDKDIEPFLPYLVALAEDNAEFFPESFLYALTGSNDQYSKIMQKQKQGRSWEMVGTPYDEFYDTSLAMLALSDSDEESTKSYLSSVQSSNGCWKNNNIRDTAFILYSGWPKAAASSGGTSSPLCTSVATQSCEIYNDCLDAGGSILNNFQCGGLTKCCSVKVAGKTCAEQAGVICGNSQRCGGNILPSSDDGTCCFGTCENIEQPVEDTCVGEGYSCKASCDNGEGEDYMLTCSNENVCCKVAEKGSYTWLIILLIILIILIALAIIYKDKLRFYWYKYKGKASAKPVIKPGVPPAEAAIPQRPVFSPSSPPVMGSTRPMPPKGRALGQSKDFEETLKKLREMSK